MLLQIQICKIGDIIYYNSGVNYNKDDYYFGDYYNDNDYVDIAKPDLPPNFSAPGCKSNVISADTSIRGFCISFVGSEKCRSTIAGVTNVSPLLSYDSSGR